MNGSPLPEELLSEIDSLILANTPLQAVKRIREYTGLSVHQSAAIMHDRHDRLREECADKFTRTVSEYWAYWYS